jgi:hypothetical protein
MEQYSHRRIYVFEGTGWYGFTHDESGSNLPADKGPWPERPLSILVYDDDRYATTNIPFFGDLDDREVKAAIDEQGFYLISFKDVNERRQRAQHRSVESVPSPEG